MFCGHPHANDYPMFSKSPIRTERKHKNPYSNRGLDKFANLMADFETRKKKIMAQVGEQDVCLIRFTYSNSHGCWVPIVIKSKDQKPAKAVAINPKNHPTQKNYEEATKSTIGSSAAARDAVKQDARMKKSFSWGKNKGDAALRRSYWHLALILILLCLVLFGRSFAIICTSVWWYLVPTLNRRDVNMRRSMKKDYDRRLSDKKLVLGATSSQSKTSHGSIST